MTISILKPGPPRSRFVSAIAWLGILSGAGTILSAGTGALFQPSLRGLAALAGGVMALIAALGLRRRREWARQAFIVVQVYTMASLVFLGMRLLHQGTMAMQGQVATVFRMQVLIMLALTAAINVLIIVKLCSRRVRAEFDAD